MTQPMQHPADRLSPLLERLAQEGHERWVEVLAAYETNLSNLDPTRLMIEYEMAVEKYCTSQARGSDYDFVRLARREVVRRLTSHLMPSVAASATP